MIKKNKLADKTAKKQRKPRGKGRPFKPGQSGNPKGRPVGSVSITTEIKRRLLQMPKGQKGRKKTYLQILITKILKKAIMDGDSQMIKNIWNYVDGFPREKIEFTGEVIHKMSAKRKKMLDKILKKNK